MRHNIFEKLTILMFFILIGLILYFTLYPFQPVTFHSMTIDKDSYCRGEQIKITLSFKKNMGGKPVNQWFIVDGVILPLEQTPIITRQIGENVFTISKNIPDSILPGIYRFRLESTYNIHPLHAPIVYIWNTPDFVVKDCDGNEQ